MNAKRPTWGNSLRLLIICVLAMMMAAGCNSGSKTNETASSNGSGTETVQKEESKQENTDQGNDEVSGDFEIQYFVGGYGDQGWKMILAEFQKKYPNVKIKESAGSKINDQMKPRWIQGNPPDFVYIDGAGSNATQMVLDDQLMDLTDYYKDAKNADDNIIKDELLLKPIEYDGKIYTLPFVFGSWGVFYDKKLFADNGWTEPKDFDSFLSESKKIRDSGKVNAPLIYTGKYPYYFHGGILDSAFVVNNNDDTSILLDMAALKEGIFKSDPVKKALAQMVQMRDAGIIDPASAPINHIDSQMLFLQHKNAFIPNGLWLENEMQKDVPQGFEFGFIPSITQPAGGKHIAIPFTATVGIAKKAKNPAAAKAFLEFLFTKQSAITWAEQTGALGNLKADLDNSNASALVKSAMKFYGSDNTIVAPYVQLNADVDKVKQDSTLALMTGSITPEEWMDRMEKAAAKVRK
ncbi:extracellular solute-binding protein [Paenibacillus sp. MER TA 81-3]|uniref:extracellular solute-binding protein n=1 Tax=Paenibacillus sp. MER TA 81-3 TaxID=2939573 RepID=UPI00204254A1|nr:extracellular solute-binding protein [Paenibacillus sp. MER TA 81-3]MCM3337154.1 extracellular solute-binding protein [Paenibacillus sp. MER TA 81-3]